MGLDDTLEEANEQPAIPDRLVRRSLLDDTYENPLLSRLLAPYRRVGAWLRNRQAEAYVVNAQGDLSDESPLPGNLSYDRMCQDYEPPDANRSRYR